MSPEELKTLGRRITDELFNQGDLTVADELFDPHYSEHICAWPDCGTGREGVKQLVTHLRRAFPDLHSRIVDQIAEGDKLVQRVTISGTHQGRAFMGTPATGTSTTINVLGILRVGPHGKVREGWTFLNQPDRTSAQTATSREPMAPGEPRPALQRQ